MTDVQIDFDSPAPARALTSEPYLIVSADNHAGPRPSRFLREYCPKKYLQHFDEFCYEQERVGKAHDDLVAEARSRIERGTGTVRDLSFDLLGMCRECEGHFDPHTRLRDMDADGVAAQVIFAGGQNDTELPWVGFGWNAGPKENRELRQASYRMWNRWIADYVSVDHERLLGVMQVPIWDIDEAVNEVEWCADAGLRVVNLHAPRDDYPPYTDLVYEPFWAVCDAVGATLATHAGASAPYGPESRRGNLLYLSEFHWFGNRGLTQLIFGGVFERYPRLKFVLTEQRVDFAPMMIKHLDSIYDNEVIQYKLASDEPRGGIASPAWPEPPDPADADPLKGLKRPSEYWRDHGYLSGSFLAPFEVALRHEVGVGNLMWGTDYPHCEGTWPHTRLALRNTFATVPEPEARMILGENAIGVYHLNRTGLQQIAGRIGPRPEELAMPVAPEEIPDGRSWAFRQVANFT